MPYPAGPPAASRARGPLGHRPVALGRPRRALQAEYTCCSPLAPVVTRRWPRGVKRDQRDESDQCDGPNEGDQGDERDLGDQCVERGESEQGDMPRRHLNDTSRGRGAVRRRVGRAQRSAGRRMTAGEAGERGELERREKETDSLGTQPGRRAARLGTGRAGLVGPEARGGAAERSVLKNSAERQARPGQARAGPAPEGDTQKLGPCSPEHIEVIAHNYPRPRPAPSVARIFVPSLRRQRKWVRPGQGRRGVARLRGGHFVYRGQT